MKRTPRNPLAPPRPPTLPPGARSRAALGLANAAARGLFRLQVCDACGTVQYPPRDLCGACLGAALTWRDVPDGGTVIAETTVRISADPYFRPRTPWRAGMVTLDAGPAAVAHLHGAVGRGARVRMRLALDKAGQGVMLALPAAEAPSMHDDRQWREMTCDPRGRRVLVSDGRSPFSQAIAHALAQAGASVLAGVADPWKPLPISSTETIPLDCTDEESVRQVAAAYGGRVEIVVALPGAIRPGAGVVRARELMESAYFGPLRLAQAFGPALRARGADGENAACAWVNVVSIYALAPDPAFAALACAHAALLSLSRTLRTELRPGGIRVVDAFVGPLDDAWHETLPPPKISPAALGAGIVRALRDGLQEIAIGDVAQDVLTRWREDAATLEREVATQ